MKRLLRLRGFNFLSGQRSVAEDEVGNVTISRLDIYITNGDMQKYVYLRLPQTT